MWWKKLSNLLVVHVGTHWTNMVKYLLNIKIFCLLSIIRYTDELGDVVGVIKAFSPSTLESKICFFGSKIKSKILAN